MKMGVCIHCRCEKVMISQAIFRLQTLRATPPGFVETLKLELPSEIPSDAGLGHSYDLISK
jgi:hypothetical protein